jgi:hypothetical protein
MMPYLFSICVMEGMCFCLMLLGHLYSCLHRHVRTLWHHHIVRRPEPGWGTPIDALVCISYVYLGSAADMRVKMPPSTELFRLSPQTLHSRDKSPICTLLEFPIEKTYEHNKIVVLFMLLYSAVWEWCVTKQQTTGTIM